MAAHDTAGARPASRRGIVLCKRRAANSARCAVRVVASDSGGLVAVMMCKGRRGVLRAWSGSCQPAPKGSQPTAEHLIGGVHRPITDPSLPSSASSSRQLVQALLADAPDLLSALPIFVCPISWLLELDYRPCPRTRMPRMPRMPPTHAPIPCALQRYRASSGLRGHQTR